MEPNDFVKHAAYRLQRGDRDGDTWVFTHLMGKAHREAFDKWLVATKHPLAYEVGSTEDRFRELVKATVAAMV